jgi:hypothetical protein
MPRPHTAPTSGSASAARIRGSHSGPKLTSSSVNTMTGALLAATATLRPREMPGPLRRYRTHGNSATSVSVWELSLWSTTSTSASRGSIARKLGTRHRATSPGRSRVTTASATELISASLRGGGENAAGAG